MSDEKKRELARRDAEATRVLIVEELRSRGHESAWLAGGRNECDRMLLVNGADVSLHVGIVYWGRATVSVSARPVYDHNYRSVLRAKTFKWSDKRKHGIDIVKVCDHVEKWIEVHKEQSEKTRAIKGSRRANEAAVKRLLAKHAWASPALDAHEDGICLTVTADEASIDAALTALSVALRGKP